MEPTKGHFGFAGARQEKAVLCALCSDASGVGGVRFGDKQEGVRHFSGRVQSVRHCLD